jgi:hypothetical protein
LQDIEGRIQVIFIAQFGQGAGFGQGDHLGNLLPHEQVNGALPFHHQGPEPVQNSSGIRIAEMEIQGCGSRMSRGITEKDIFVRVICHQN